MKTLLVLSTVLAVLFLAAPSKIEAQTTERVSRLEARIAQLEKRLAEVESKLAKIQGTPSSAAQAQPSATRSSPKSTVNAMCSALRNKDVNALKKHLSVYVLSNPGNLPFLLDFLNNTEVCGEPNQARGEQIDGNEGSLYLGGRKLGFVIEDDEWKFNWFIG